MRRRAHIPRPALALLFAVRRRAHIPRPALALLFGLVALTACAASATARADEASDIEQAQLSWAALQQAYYLPQVHLYRGEAGPSGGPYSYFFPLTQTLAAANALASVPSLTAQYRPLLAEHLLGLGAYWNPRSRPPGYDSAPLAVGGAEKFYDDNEWAGLQLVRSYRLLGEYPLLAQAEATFQLIAYGWDSDRSHPCPGGVWWSQREGSFTRNTVSNAPGAELALELYQLTRRPYYLQWGRRIYHWVRVCLRESVGLYADSITLSGYVDPTYWIYNQGTMVGAEVLLYEITHQRSYLEDAVESAASTLAYFNAERLAGQPPAFVAIFAEDLLHLNAVAADPAYAAYLEEYGERTWASERNPATGLFEFHEPQPDPLLNQAAMVELYAYLAWQAPSFTAPPPAPPPPPQPRPPKRKPRAGAPRKAAKPRRRSAGARHGGSSGGSRAP